MTGLSFRIDWEPADSVTHPALASTWARIEIRVGDDCVTTVFDERVGSTRDGIYGAAFLLAEWITRNFWFLTCECAPGGDRPSAAWSRRHSLLASREGMSLPDLRCYRDEDLVVVEWHKTDQSRFPVDFVGSGRAELEPLEVQHKFAEVVDLVLDRLRACPHPDVKALREDWEATTSVSGSDRMLCHRAARLGLDAFDDNEVDETLSHMLIEGLEALPEPTLSDLLDSQVAREQLGGATHAVKDATEQLGKGPVTLGNLAKPELFSGFTPRQPAHERGYAAARAFRQALGDGVNGQVHLDPIVARLGWKSLRAEASHGSYPASIKAVVGASPEGAPRILAPHKSLSRHERFLVARGIFALASGAASRAPRLLTTAGSGLQAASRAFAAELLAPAEALRVRLRGVPDEEQVEELAEAFDVSTMVVEHQIQNHGL